MSNFVSLAKALIGYFDDPLNGLPIVLRNRVLEELETLSWDTLTPEQRFNIASQRDYLNDPATEIDRLFWMDFFDREETINSDIKAWEEVSTKSHVDSELMKNRITELKQQLALMEQHKIQARGDFPSSENPMDLTVGSPEWRKQLAAKAADARHSKPGGSRDKKQQIRDVWAAGKYTTRDICAEQECAGLGMSFSAARSALRNTPNN